MLRLLVILQILVTVWWVYLQQSPGVSDIQHFLFNGMYGLIFLTGGVGGLFHGIRLGGFRSTVGRAITFISLGLSSYGIGQFIWMSYNLIFRQPVPYPSYADLFFITATPLFGIGFWHILRMYRTFITHRLAGELAIAFVIASAAIMFILGLPDVSSELGFGAKFLNVFYPFGDALLVSLAFVTFRTGGGTVDKSIIMYAVGMLLLAAADTVFTYRNNVGIYWNGDISDFLFALSGFFISLGIIKTVRSFLK